MCILLSAEERILAGALQRMIEINFDIKDGLAAIE
jgi:hypothetical protein